MQTHQFPPNEVDHNITTTSENEEGRYRSYGSTRDTEATWSKCGLIQEITPKVVRFGFLSYSYKQVVLSTGQCTFLFFSEHVFQYSQTSLVTKLMSPVKATRRQECDLNEFSHSAVTSVIPAPTHSTTSFSPLINTLQCFLQDEAWQTTSEPKLRAHLLSSYFNNSACRAERRDRHIHILKTRIRQVLCQVYVQSGWVPEPSPAQASLLLRRTTPPLSPQLGSCIHAAKMYRFSVSYTQRGVFSILAGQTQALATRNLATSNKEKLGTEVQRRAAVQSRSETIAGEQKKNTHRKWTKKNTGSRVGTRGQARPTVEHQDIAAEANVCCRFKLITLLCSWQPQPNSSEPLQQDLWVSADGSRDHIGIFNLDVRRLRMGHGPVLRSKHSCTAN